MSNKTEIKNYMDLDVWKVSHEFVVEIYKVTKDFPKNEIYGLSSQLRRAASSIPANIAEGNGKQYIKGYIQSLYISKSSLNEVKYFLLLSTDLNYIDTNIYQKLIEKSNRIGMILSGLIKSLKRKIK